MIKLRQINDEIVRPIKYMGAGQADTRPIKGVELFSELYANIFICAKKKSGKTIVASKIIRDCCTTDTTVLVFASTADKDQTHLAIKHYCKNKNINYCAHTSMKDENIDILDELIKRLNEEARQPESDDDDEVEEKRPLILFDSETDEDDEPKKRKNKFQAPEYLIFIDDLSNELKSTTLVKLLKMNRHYKMKVIVSSQYVHDLNPASLKQMDYCLVFKGMQEVKLEKLYKDFDLTLDYNTFLKIYQHATLKQFSFLYIDIRADKFRRCFNFMYDV